jgi:hypothetical protein
VELKYKYLLKTLSLSSKSGITQYGFPQRFFKKVIPELSAFISVCLDI